MYAINFELDKTKLEQKYNIILENNDQETNKLDQLFGCLGFKKYNEGFYICSNDYVDDNSLHLLYKLIEILHECKWFKDTVIKIQAFRVHDVSDFTDIIKG